MSIPSVVGLIVVLIALGLLVFRSGSKAPSGDDGPTGTLDIDQATLSALREAGADLSKETAVTFYLYFPTEAQAKRAAEVVEVGNTAPSIEREPDGSVWLLFLQARLVPSEKNIREASQHLQRVAEEHGGEYDGWEAAITR